MSMLVYLVSGAPRSWRVLLGLTFKGLDFETHYLEASKGEHKASEFLKINPRGKVPALQTGSLILRDSIAILAWLDRQYPEKPLFGESANDAAHIWQTTMECCDYLRAAGQELLFPILFLHNPTPEENSEEMAALNLASEAMLAEFHYLETLLESNEYLCGDRPSAADAVAFPEIRLVQRAIEVKPELMDALGFGEIKDLYPKVSAWLTQIEALPGMSEIQPRHWG